MTAMRPLASSRDARNGTPCACVRTYLGSCKDSTEQEEGGGERMSCEACEPIVRDHQVMSRSLTSPKGSRIAYGLCIRGSRGQADTAMPARSGCAVPRATSVVQPCGVISGTLHDCNTRYLAARRNLCRRLSRFNSRGYKASNIRSRKRGGLPTAPHACSQPSMPRTHHYEHSSPTAPLVDVQAQH